MVLYWRVSQGSRLGTGSEHGPVLASLSRQLTGTGSEHGPVLASLSRQPTGDWI